MVVHIHEFLQKLHEYGLLIVREFLKDPLMQTPNAIIGRGEQGHARIRQVQDLLTPIIRIDLAGKQSLFLQAQRDTGCRGRVDCCQPCQRDLIDAWVGVQYTQNRVLNGRDERSDLVMKNRGRYLLCTAQQVSRLHIERFT